LAALKDLKLKATLCHTSKIFRVMSGTSFLMPSRLLEIVGEQRSNFLSLHGSNDEQNNKHPKEKSKHGRWPLWLPNSLLDEVLLQNRHEHANWQNDEVL